MEQNIFQAVYVWGALYSIYFHGLFRQIMAILHYLQLARTRAAMSAYSFPGHF